MINPRLKSLMEAISMENVVIPETNNLDEGEGTKTAGTSFIEDETDFWRIDNVPYRNRIHSVCLAKTLLDTGSAKTQDEWAEYSRQAQQQENFYVGDFPLYYSLSTQLHSLRENPGMKDIAEEVRQFISKQMFEKWLMTLTRLQYKAAGKDTIVHNYGMPDRYGLNGNIKGKDGLITDAGISARSMLELLTGENNPARVNEVYKWITGKETYLWRLNTTSQDTERVAGFDAFSDGVGLDCNGNPENSNSALGVRVARRAAQN